MRPASVVAAAAALLRDWALLGRSVGRSVILLVKLKYFQTMLFAAVLREKKIRISFLKNYENAAVFEIPW
jgi:hypothetical protein